ncbi:MAG: CpsD/CapB family tyrosine-protein kinase [Phycisphaerae bacterium]|nr:CpsD/CapB family tyrosine-protein kinase [Phycisphaerae bacterium]
MDQGLENLTRFIEWVSRRSGQYLFLIGELFFLVGLGGWFVLAIRRRIINRRKSSSPNPVTSDPKVLADRILESAVCPSVILMASEHYDCLSVTIPVQTAMEMVRRKKKCLLMDLDLARNAVARVFELESLPGSDHPRPIQTTFKDLHIWPAEYFTGNRLIPPSKVVAAASGFYDIILIYAPVLSESPFLQTVAAACQSALVFHPVGNRSENLRLALQKAGAILYDISSEFARIPPRSFDPTPTKKMIAEIGNVGHNGGTIQKVTAIGETEERR